MSDNTPVELEKNRIQIEGQIKQTQLPANPAQVYQKAVDFVSEQLTRAGHPQPPKKVSATGEADAVLEEIKKNNPDADVIAELGHEIPRLTGEFFGGSDHKNLAREGSEIHLEPVKRVAKIAAQERKPIPILNFFFRRKKAA